jgi:hypothetical protein
MPLQNRVTPFGEIVAVEARGSMLGNRGGKFHRDDKTLGRRRWASHHWICCELHYKDMHHEPMGRGYTSLFFLDEVTALAAGHRPCFFCRRSEAKRFLALSGFPDVDALDRALHQERLSAPREQGENAMVDGLMVAVGNTPYAVRGGCYLRWSHEGYRERMAPVPARLLTPPSIAAILRAGYQPRWHESATEGD